MQQKGAHHQEPAPRYDARDLLKVRSTLLDGALAQFSILVRSRKNTHRSVRRAARIQMHAHGDHALEDFSWGLHVNNAGFDGPRAKASDVASLSDGDREVLMPRDLPVC